MVTEETELVGARLLDRQVRSIHAVPEAEARDSSARPVRILAVDDHLCFGAGLDAAFGAIGFEVQFEPIPVHFSDVVPLVSAGRADLVLIGICGSMGADVLEFVRSARASTSSPRMALLACNMSPGSVTEALQSGVHGVVSRHLEPVEVAAAIRLIVRGDRFVSSCFIDHSHSLGDSDDDLTEDEPQILKYYATGVSSDAVADAMFMSRTTFKRRMRSILSKLGVGTKVEALVVVAKRGLI